VRRFQSIGFLLSAFTGLMVVMLIAIFTFSAVDAYRREQKARTVLATITDIRRVLAAGAGIRNELALANLMLDTSSASKPDTIANLERLQRSSEKIVRGAIYDAAHRDVADSKAIATSMIRTNSEFVSLFSRVEGVVREPREARDPHVFAQWRATSTILTRQLSAELELLEQEAAGRDPFIDATLKISDAAWNLRMDAGRERGFVQTAIIDNSVPTLVSLQYLAELRGMVIAHWNIIRAQTRRSTMPVPIKHAIANALQIYLKQATLRDDLLKRLVSGQKVAMTGEQWVAFSNKGLSSILTISATALNLCGARALQLARDAHGAFIDALALMALSLVLAFAAVACIVLRVIRPLKAITLNLRTHERGDTSAAIPYEDHQDEIGEFARALRSFRAGALERERLKSELLEQRSAKDAAEAANQIKATFLASMSHELRTPLNAILGFSEVLKSELYGPLGHEKYGEYAGYVFKSATHLLDLINDVLDLSKIEAGQMELKETSFALTDLVSETMLMVREKARNHCTLTVSEKDQLPEVIADKRLIKQILLNILSNAIKFTPDGGHVSVSIQLLPEDIIVQVSDTGIGMDATELGVAFSPYGQIDSKIARQHQGTGLGLPISRSLAELHGGTLKAESSKGNGTVVTLSLPRARIVQAVHSIVNVA
jgi:signal transduction histidine kinase